MDHAFTVGVEEEFQIVDPTTWELRSHVSELLASSAPAFGDHIKREMHQSIVEVGTKICGSIEELAGEIIRTRRDLADAAERVGLRIAAAGTHPFSNWMDQVISPGERYETHRRGAAAAGALAADLRPARARRGARPLVDDRPDERGALLPAAPARALDQLAVLDGARHRPEVVPHDGLPPLSAHRHPRSLRLVDASTRSYVELLVELHCIDNGKKIWWDLRPQPTFGTLEFRICDVPTAPCASIAIAALAQAIIVKLYRLRERNLGFRRYHRALIEENKWRAARWGIDGKLIDFGKRREVPMRELADGAARVHRRCGGRSGEPAGGRVRPHDSGRRHQRGKTAAGVPRDRRPARGRPVDRRRDARRRRAIGDDVSRVSELGLARLDELRLMTDEKSDCCAAASTRFRRRSSTASTRWARPHGITARVPEADRHEDGRAVGLRGHRRSHLARGRVLPRVSEARRARGHLRHQQPVLVDGRRQVLQLLGRAEARRGGAEDRACCRRRAIRRTST